MSRKASVLDPTGFPPAIVRRGLAPGLGKLDGRRLFLVDVGFENSDNFMRQLRDWFAEHLPAVDTEVVRWADQHKPDPALCERIRGEGDGAILGVGL